MLGGTRQEHKVARVVDTRLEATSGNQVTYVVEEGAAVANYTPLTSSSHSSQNTVWNLNNIADRTCRDSRMAMGMTVTATFTVNNSDASAHTLINADNFGLKQWPLNRCMTSIQHQINQASYTLQSNQILPEIARLNTFPMDADFYENTQPDTIDSYANATGSNLTPLGPYTNTLLGDGVYKPRTLNWDVSGNSVAGSATGATVTVTATLYEPLISPFNNVSSKNRRGLYAITGEIINIQWVSQLFNNMFAFVAPQFLTVTNTVVSLGSSATLYTVYLTPQEGFFPEIPRESVYPYNDYSVFSNDLGPCAAGATLSQKSTQVVNFTGIPQKILVYARLSDSARTAATPDKYLTISNINCTFDNGLPQLSNATPDQLYDVSKRNGLQMPRSAFKQSVLNRSLVAATGAPALYGCGSVLVVDPALDLGLRYDSANGSNGRYIFQATANLTNNTGTDFPAVTLYVVGINSAILERVGSQYRNYLLSLPIDVLAEAKELPPVDHQSYTDAKHSNGFLSGGGIGDWFKKAFNNAKGAVKFALDHKDDIVDATKLAHKFLKKGGAQNMSLARDIHPQRPRDLFYE